MICEKIGCNGAVTNDANLNPPESACTHCGNLLTEDSPNPTSSTGPFFCCVGCQTVYQILHENGLSLYYQLKEKGDFFRKPTPIQSTKEKFSYLDDPDFLSRYAGSNQKTLQFYLEGIHCVACLWLIEKLPILVEKVESARLDLGTGVVTVRIFSGGSFSNVAHCLSQLGYRPHPVQKDEEAQKIQQKENRTQLIRLGVAAAGTGNIMLLAVSLYGGASGGLGKVFEYLSALLYLPVLFFSGAPFFKSTWGALRSRQLSIDVPIVLAIVVGSILSYVNLFKGFPTHYFDSLSMLIFLLLASRLFLRRVQQSVLSTSHLMHFLSPRLVHRLDLETGFTTDIQAELLQKGDWAVVLPGEVIPADGVLKSEHANLNLAVLTGESLPKSLVAGSKVFTGTVNEGECLHMQVEQVGYETRLGKILKSIETGHLKKAPLVTFADRIAQFFLVAMLVAAGVLLLIHWKTPAQGVARALSLLIVTCPCALGLATPLAFSLALRRGAQEGSFIKGADVLEKVSHVKTLFFDKTGTLTEGKLKVIHWFQQAQFSTEIEQAVIALESRSKHPIARALVKAMSDQPNLPKIEDFKEVIGEGVSGKIAGVLYQIGRWPYLRYGVSFQPAQIGQTRVAVWREGELVASITLGDKLRSHSKQVIQQLMYQRVQPYLLSGDHQAAVHAMGASLKLEESFCLGEKTPEEKSLLLKQHPHSMMVGDGANDALALSQAYVGVAVQGSMEVSLRAADVYLTDQGLWPLVDLFALSRQTLKVIHRNFLISFFYNSMGGAAAFLGYVSPLFAAFLMPISSLTVLVATLIGMKRRLKNKGQGF